MKRLGVLLALLVVWVAGVGVVGSRRSADPAVLTVVGHVSMVTSVDGLTTAVSIDADGPGQLPDGLVDRAFRIQHKMPQVLAYDGNATINFAETGLRVTVDGHKDWMFSVEGTTPSLSSPPPQAWVIVRGLSHHWGERIHAPAAEVAAFLLASGCAADADPSCDRCEAGGQGVGGCALECGGGNGCSARCGAGMFACCNCPGACRCCPAEPEH